jgi:polysaccharide export outer membrane protein
MKALKSVLALALTSSFAASPARAQQQQPPAKPAVQQKQQKQQTPQTGQQPAPAGSVLTPMPVKEVDTYTERRDYLLGPSDVLELRVFNDPQFNGDFEVDPDGNVSIPFVEDLIPAKCRSVNALRKDVAAALGRFLRDPRVYLHIKEQKSHKPVVIYGAVRTPSPWDMRRPVRLLELLSNSGGVTEQHSGTIQIMHTEPPQCPDIEPEGGTPVQSVTDPLGLPFSIYKVADLRQGKPEANPYLRPGDIVYVAEAPPVYVVGSVASPANLYLREGTMLTRVIAQVGGMKDANEEKVTIHRQDEHQQQQLIAVNYKAIKAGKAPDVILQPYDIVEVPKRGLGSVEGITKMLTGMGLSTVQSMGAMAPMRILY